MVCGDETMARNKYPEQTIEKIVKVSTKLFIEKGYDNTSLQDIINELDGLTKGAIYHHFKSKEDIFDAVATKLDKDNRQYFLDMKNNHTLTGAEKLKEVLVQNVFSESSATLLDIVPNLLNNPKFLATQLKYTMLELVPVYIFPIIEQGVNDGSIICDKPYELAELIALLINTWLNPFIFGDDKSKTVNKCKMINEITVQFGFTLFDDEFIEKFEKL